MKVTPHRLQQLEDRLETIPTTHTEEEQDDAFSVWCLGGCQGVPPPAGPRPPHFRTEEAWQKHHRFLVALCCRSAGRDDPPEMGDEERREVADTLAFFATMGMADALSLPQQARLSPYREAIEQYVQGGFREGDSHGEPSNDGQAAPR